MIQIRKNVFETNSSSTHALALAKEADYKNHPDVVYFEQGEFGWEDEEVSSADYLYTYILTQVEGWYRDDVIAVEEILDSYYIKRIDDLLSKFGIKCVFDGYTIENDSYDSSRGVEIAGYIDHQSSDMLATIFDDLMSDEKLLYRYLFASHVYTGNDNESSEAPDYILKRNYGDKQIATWNSETKSYDYLDNPYYDPEHYDYYD